MQSESRRAAPQASQPPSKASARTFNSTTLRPRSENSLRTSGSGAFFSFSSFSIPDQKAVSRFAAFLLRMKALAPQKRPLFVLLVLAGRTAAILDVAMLLRRRGCAVQNKGITLKILFNDHVFSCNWKYCLHGSHIWITSITLPWNWFIYIH